ncbi:hypothetical protein SAMN04487926_12233 [Paraburkholderia steynii]|uniref:Uncharacterized protein n=1 Tax=Paraburkholderia steynii TaxID=1245441 RepID=A0A7Z7FLX7_9BURK|nr:hypothetical protein [Paraburkholderia steynii]SDI70152.1 hypothetical protein SAMN04487926_12233 [Paraburkholderia steynii]
MAAVPMEQVIICSGSALAALPLLLVIAYVALGRGRRIEELKSYVRSSARAADVLPPDAKDAAQADAESLGDHFARRFLESHRKRAYFASLVVFYSVYGVLLYWSFLAWGRALTLAAGSPVESPALWSVVRLGAAGAFGATFGAIWHLHWRVIRLDLQPRTLLQLSARLSVSPFLAIAIAGPLPTQSPEATLVAFGAGLFGDEALRRVRWLWHKALQIAGRKESSLSLQLVQGISSDDELRLWEEGIADVQHLAVETVLSLITNTSYSLERIVDWKDQAYLCMYVGEEITKWRSVSTRGALDVLGMAPEYYGNAPHEAVVAALAKTVGKDPDILKRLINTIYNDPQVHQLWSYVENSYPAELAQTITERSKLAGARGRSPTPSPTPVSEPTSPG